MSNLIETDLRGSIQVIRFIRPELRNPLSVVVLEELSTILNEISPEISLVIFTGTDHTFASGADLREIAAIDTENVTEFARRGQDLFAKIANLPQKTAAAINGFCFGGALDLALACDKRFASPQAVFAHPGVSLGIITGWGGTQRLPRLIGQTHALEMFLLAKRIDADEALRFGLIDEIADDPLEKLCELELFQKSPFN